MTHARSAFGFALALALMTPACNSGSSGTDTAGLFDDQPYRDAWQTVIETSFPLAGDAPVKSLTIGRAEYMENYANRGDVEVLFDRDDETIQVEMRKYAWQASEDEAKATYDKLSIWAYVASTPDKPQNMAPEDDCTAGWQDGCAIYVYYDGLAQPVRTGADLRVHLPKAYRNRIKVETEDNTQETNYKLRGDVTIKDLCGSADVVLENGVVQVRMCAELQEGPTCSAAQMQDCVDKNWDAACACQDFGSLKVSAPEPWAANITVDFPNTIWANVNAENKASSSGLACGATFENCGAGCVLDQSPETPQRGKAEYNYPGEPATPGVGYVFNLDAASCEGVFYVDGPDDYDPDALEAPKDEKRGDIKLCTGCLADL